jgi:long-chain fatty acid transport protein
VPSGIGNNYGKGWSGRYLSQEAEITFVAVSGVLGYKLTDNLSIGGGPIYMYADSTSKASINNIGENRPDGRIRLDEKGSDVGWQLGLMYEFSDSARLGAVYKSDFDPDLEDSPDIDGIGPLLEDALRSAGVLDQHVDVDFKIPAIAQLGYYQEFMDKWSFTVDGMWLNTSDFGLNHVSVDSDSLSVNTDFRDAWLFSAGLKYHYRPDLAFAVGALHMSSPISDGRRGVGLPLDRIISVGAGVDWQWKDLRIVTNLSYVDKGDGHVDQDGGLAGSVKGSFDQNYAVVLDVQVGKRF